jgi:glycosyltransferase 2 family protein
MTPFGADDSVGPTTGPGARVEKALAAECGPTANVPGVGWAERLAEAILIPDAPEPAELRRRRPADAITLLVALSMLVVTALRITSATHFEVTLAELVNSLPSDLTGVATFLYRLGALWYVGLIAGASLIVGRRHLALAVLLAGVTAWACGRLLLAVGGDREPPLSIVVRAGRYQAYPVVRVGVAVAVLTAAAPYLTVLARRIGATVTAVVGVAAIFLGSGLPNDVVGGTLIGIIAGTAVKLVSGSPTGRPTIDQIRRALAELGVRTYELRYAVVQPRGTTLLIDRRPDHDLVVRAYGRDERDAQLLAKAWRFVWYEESGPPLALTRLQQVEHEAYVMLLAGHAGVRVPDLLAAARAGPGTATLIERRPRGIPAQALSDEDLNDETLARIWREAAQLWRAGIAHGAFDLDAVLVADRGDVVITGFDRGSATATMARRHADAAQLLVACAVRVGPKRAAAAAVRALGPDDLGQVAAFVQSPLLTESVRRSIRHQKALLVEVRSAAAATAGVEQPPLADVARVHPRSVVLAAFTFLGAYLLLGQLASFGAISGQLSRIRWPWVILAVLASASTNFGFALAYTGATPAKLSFRSVVALQAAGSFTNLVTPSGVGTTAINIRFLQLRGVGIASAMASSLANTIASIVVNLSLALLVAPAVRSSFDVGRIPWRSLLGLVLLVVAALTVLGAIAWRLPRLRRAYQERVRPALTGMAEVTRTPNKLALVIGGNLVAALLYGLALTAVCRAYGLEVSFGTLLVVNIVITYMVGLVPVPGSMGVAEAGLAAGLTAVGIPNAAAVAVALTHRLITGWLPPVPGWVALRYLQKHDDL